MLCLEVVVHRDAPPRGLPPPARYGRRRGAIRTAPTRGAVMPTPTAVTTRLAASGTDACLPRYRPGPAGCPAARRRSRRPGGPPHRMCRPRGTGTALWGGCGAPFIPSERTATTAELRRNVARMTVATPTHGPWQSLERRRTVAVRLGHGPLVRNTSCAVFLRPSRDDDASTSHGDGARESRCDDASRPAFGLGAAHTAPRPSSPRRPARSERRRSTGTRHRLSDPL